MRVKKKSEPQHSRRHHTYKKKSCKRVYRTTDEIKSKSIGETNDARINQRGRDSVCKKLTGL